MSTNSLGSILGPILMGILINIFLFGIVVNQVCIYLRYASDTKWIKTTVAFVFFTDCLACVFTVVNAYVSYVDDFGDPLVRPGPKNKVKQAIPFLTGFTAFMVQMFYSWRIHVLTRSNMQTIIAVVLSTLQLAGSIAQTIQYATYHNNITQFLTIDSADLIWQAGSAAADLWITLNLLWNLSRSRTGCPQMERILSKIVRVTAETGLVTSMFALTAAVAWPTYFPLSITFSLPLSTLHAGSLLISLNSRPSKEQREASQTWSAWNVATTFSSVVIAE